MYLAHPGATIALGNTWLTRQESSQRSLSSMPRVMPPLAKVGHLKPVLGDPVDDA